MSESRQRARRIAAKPAETRPAEGKSLSVVSTSSRKDAHRTAKQPRSRKLLKSYFDNAFELLMQREKTKRYDLQDEDDIEEVVICSEVSQSEVLRYLDKHEKIGFRVRFHPIGKHGPDTDPNQIMGKLIATELPVSAHETTKCFVDEQLFMGIFRKYGVASLKSRGSPTCTIPDYGIKEPDASCAPGGLVLGPNVLDLGDGNPFPTCVSEVAYRNESLPTLRAELEGWISARTSVMVAIGIKIFEGRADGTRRMLALVYRRGVANPEQAVEFGTTLPTAAGLQLVISVADLYHGADVPAGHAAGDIVTIDLEALQVEILSVIH